MNKHMFNELIAQRYFVAGDSDYIWLPEMEWLDKNEAFERKKVWSDVFNLQELELFAIDGYGDMYAWFTEGVYKEQVAFISLDSEFGGEFFAPNLSAAIFRRILEFSSGLYTKFYTNNEEVNMADSDEYMSESEAVEILTRCRLAFGSYFEDQWNKILNKMIERGINDQNCFINEDKISLQELTHILNYKKIGTSIILKNQM